MKKAGPLTKGRGCGVNSASELGDATSSWWRECNWEHDEEGLMSSTVADVAGGETGRGAHNLKIWRSAACNGIVFTRGTKVAHQYPRHWHDELHFCAYFAGAGYLGHRGSTHLVTAGDFVVTPPGEVHHNWVEPDASVSYRGAYLDAANFRRVTEEISGRELGIPEIREVFVREELLRRSFMTMYLDAERGDSQLQQEEGLLEFLGCFLSKCSEGFPLRIRVGKEHSAVKRARQYIDEHFAEAISLARISELTNLSPFHLHRVFSQEIGIPPHAYQTQVRINRAKRLLGQRHTLSAVALSTGFVDQSHLTRHFRRLVGVTPGQFII